MFLILVLTLNKYTGLELIIKYDFMWAWKVR